jgi:SAM-dependent methyltransferase
MNERLPRLYDELEPVALRIAERAAGLEPADPQRAYLVGVAGEIVRSGEYRRDPPAGASGREQPATLTWFEILADELEPYVRGARSAADLIARGGGALWVEFQAREPICRSWAQGVAATVAGRAAGSRVLELGAGTGGTTRLLAPSLRDCRQLVISDVRQSFLDRIAADLDGVPVATALVDVDDPDPSIGTFDLVYATNCLHVSRDVDGALERLRGLLRPGGTLVLGEGAHYSDSTPSPLALVLSLFDGWWDAPATGTRARPGFLQPDQWLAALRRAGYEVAHADRWTDGRREFGGVYVAGAPA